MADAPITAMTERAMGKHVELGGRSSRRLFLLSPITLFVAPVPEAEAMRPAPPPPPSLRELVQRADAICVATAHRYVYRGVDLLRLPEENGHDFEKDNEVGNRTLEVLLAVSEWLYGAPELRADLVRVNQPLSGKARDGRLEREHVYLLLSDGLYRTPDGLKRVYGPLTPPLPATARSQLAGFLKELLANGEKT